MASQKKPIYLVSQSALRKKGERIPPLGLLYIGQSLKQAGYRVRIINPSEPSLKAVEAAVREETPLFVGFSNFISDLVRYDVETSRWLSGQGIPVVWGGIFPTTLPEPPLRSGWVDYVVMGEGELVVASLCEAIENREKPRGIPGVGYLDGEEVVLNPPAKPHLDLDSHGLAWDLLELDQYIQKYPEKNLQIMLLPFSRGCPHRCIFCYNAMNPNRQKWRAHSLEFMRDMISFMKKNYSANAFRTVADNAFGKVSEAKKIIEGMETPWLGTTHFEVVNPDFVKWARNSGCLYLSFGAESGSDRVLKLMGKNFTADDIREKLELIREQGIVSATSWIGLTPGETFEDLNMTFSLMDEIYESDPAHGFKFNICRAYPVTPLWEVRTQHGLPEPATLEEWAEYKPEINTISGYSDKQAQRLRFLANLLYPFVRSSAKPIPKGLRSLLKARLARTRMRLPIEEVMRSVYRSYKSGWHD